MVVPVYNPYNSMIYVTYVGMIFSR